MRQRSTTVALAVALAACGADSMRDPGTAALRADALAVEAEVAAYQGGAAAMADAGACVAMHSTYDARVREMLDRMRALAPAMDAHMAEMGRAGHADMECAVQQMRDELDRHAAEACASQGDMAPNVAEVGAHAGAMDGWAEHARARCDELGGMMHGGGMMGGDGPMGGGTDPATLTCPPAP